MGDLELLAETVDGFLITAPYSHQDIRIKALSGEWYYVFHAQVTPSSYMQKLVLASSAVDCPLFSPSPEQFHDFPLFVPKVNVFVG